MYLAKNLSIFTTAFNLSVIFLSNVFNLIKLDSQNMKRNLGKRWIYTATVKLMN